MSKFIFRYELAHDDNPDVAEDAVRVPKAKIKTVYIECYISKDHKSTRRLNLFFEESGRIDLYQTSNYFIAYLNLLADICYGKNTSASEYIEQILKPQRTA